MIVDLDQAIINPSSIFKRPYDVLDNQLLTRQQKIEILKRWAYDERNLAVAEEENMLDRDSQQKSFLEEIIKALLILGVTHDQDLPPPTKQG